MSVDDNGLVTEIQYLPGSSIRKSLPTRKRHFFVGHLSFT